MQEDYYSVLARMIAATTQDDGQLRRMVYELARQKLRRQLSLQYQHLPRPEMMDQIIELETAITQIESDAAQNVPLLSLPRPDAVNGGSQGATGTDLVLRQSSIQATVLNANLVEILGPAAPVPVQLRRVDSASALPPLAEFDAPYRPAWSSDTQRGTFWFKAQVVGAVLIGILVFGIFDRRAEIGELFGVKSGSSTAALIGGAPQTSSQAVAPPVIRTTAPPPDPGFPVPSSYGVYAIDDGKLIKLPPLPIRVPDVRVAISGVITTPSQISLPDGRLQFVVFRRNLMNDAPDSVAVRVVAEVMHALSFNDSKATTTNVSGSWAVRSNSYDMKVSPVDGYPEMIVLRPRDDNLPFPPGRYALALKDAAYDFTVSGAVTDPVHCLERTDAKDAQFYSECRRP
jgi:hypothetical protein